MAPYSLESPGNSLSLCSSYTSRIDDSGGPIKECISHLCLSRCARCHGNIGCGAPLGHCSRVTRNSLGNDPIQYYHPAAPVFIELEYISGYLRNMLSSNYWHDH